MEEAYQDASKKEYQKIRDYRLIFADLDSNAQKNTRLNTGTNG